MKPKILLGLISSLLFINISVTGQTYQFAESSEYDPVNHQWLTSNGSNIIAEKPDGTLSFFGTASASHGMEVMNDILFAIDNNIIRGYDLSTTDEVMAFSIPGVTFLNGMTTNDTSKIWVTDFSANKIYRIDVEDIQNPSYEEIVSNTQSMPNGIIFDPQYHRLIFVNWEFDAEIKEVDLETNEVTTLVFTELKDIDGIVRDHEDNYLISSWAPDQITKYDKDFANPPEIITTPFLTNPADIGYSKQTDTLAIPVGNNVIFVGFETTSNQEIADNDFNLSIFPNPVSASSYVQFELKNAGNISLDILDNQGKLIKTLVQGLQNQGKHKVLLAGMDFPSGIYYCRLSTSDQQVIQKMFIP